MSRFLWTSEVIERMRTMFAAGHTASEIATDIGATSRSAVCGKLFRLREARVGPAAPTVRRLARVAEGVTRAFPRPKAPKPPSTPRKAAAPKPEHTPRPRVVEVISANPLAMLDLPWKGACRWIVDTDNALSCGNDCGEATYCPGHRALAYRPAAAPAERVEAHVRFLEGRARPTEAMDPPKGKPLTSAWRASA